MTSQEEILLRALTSVGVIMAGLVLTWVLQRIAMRRIEGADLVPGLHGTSEDGARGIR